jgi:alpha-beta hydrolase superfamily lysophospholipase
MTPDLPISDMPQVHRRQLMQAAGAAVVATAAASVVAGSAAAQGSTIVAEEHWAKKGAVDLYIYRKRLQGDAGVPRPILFLVHGSSFSSRGTYDLNVPGHPDYSMMDHFAGLGFDVWTMDHEGYGRSSRTQSNAGIMVGVEDLKAALPVVERITSQSKVMLYGESSGAIRAAAFAVAEPARVERLILSAYTHTGERAPEIERRRAQVETYKANPRRPISRASIQRIFERDVPGTFEPAVAEALASHELAIGDTVPVGTYLDVAINLPMADPSKLACPVCLIRAEHDGNATEEELMAFYGALATKDKQFVMLAGLTHVAGFGLNRHRLWHAMQSFLTYPPVRTA